MIDLVPDQAAGVRRIAIVLIIAISVVWGVLTSSAYMFPVIDLGSRYLSKDGWKPDAIYTNSRSIKTLTEIACWFVPSCKSRVLLLEDNPEYFPLDSGWVLWSPVNDSHYPSTRKILGYNAARGYGLYPSFNLPREWGVVSSAQSLVSIIRVGPWWVPKFYLPDLGEVRLDGNELRSGVLEHKGGVASPRVTKSIWLAPNVSRILEFIANDRNGVPVDELFIDLQYMSGGTIHLSVTAESTFGEKTSETISVNSEGGREKVHLALSSSPVKNISISMVSDVLANSSIYFRDRFLPSISNKIGITEPGKQRSTAHLAFDRHHSTAWVAQKPGAAVLELDMGELKDEALILYRLSGVQFRGFEGVQPGSWRLEGTVDDVRWNLLDERKNMALPGGPGEFISMYIQNPGVYSRYRLKMFPKESEQTGKLGLSEIELYSDRVLNDEYTKATGG